MKKVINVLKTLSIIGSIYITFAIVFYLMTHNSETVVIMPYVK